MLLDLPITGVVLTGGQSSRMGTDKAQLSYHDRPQYQYIYDLLTLFCSRTFLSVKKFNYPLSYPQLKDQYDFGGPLNGILTALANFPGSAILTIPCDMPSISGETVKLLSSNHKQEKLATCFVKNNEPEPLFTIWNPACYPLLLQQVNSGNHSPMFFLKNNDVNLIHIAADQQLINVNTPEERHQFLQA
ncbi:MAG: molybdenum cofactor guanylyltransferase [Candidatus Cyclobacteriaceae bacterium M2_1C_046]